MLTFKEYLKEEIANIPKWWYNTKARKAVKVSGDFHIQQVFRTPEAFGLTEDDLAKFDPKVVRLRSRIAAIAGPLRRKGWVEVTWLKRPNTVVLRAENNNFGQKTLDWFLKKVNATPRVATIVRPDGSDRLTTPTKITAFAKTGKIIQQTEIGATMARFR